MRVALRPPAGAHEDGPRPAAAPLLEAMPQVVLGGARWPEMARAGIAPAADTCFGPRGAVLLRADGPLVACDTGHHRLLAWRRPADVDQPPADLLFGQPHFAHEGRNAGGVAGPETLNVPTGISGVGSGGLAVADAWNHRVLVWHRAEDLPGPPDLVLGQACPVDAAANRGRDTPDAASLHWPYGVFGTEELLAVADSGNRRVLIWSLPLTDDGQPADVVLGQPGFDLRNENAGGEPNAATMRWPHDVALWRGNLCVADAGNNRIMVWGGIPERNGAPCQWVLGQRDMRGTDHNQSAYWPRADTLNMPYGVTTAGDWLLVADTANSRLLGWHIDDLATGAPARRLAGQRDFTAKGDNRWAPPAEDSFCWPYGIRCTGDRVVVADSGNHRISVWRLAA